LSGPWCHKAVISNGLNNFPQRGKLGLSKLAISASLSQPHSYFKRCDFTTRRKISWAIKAQHFTLVVSQPLCDIQISEHVKKASYKALFPASTSSTSAPLLQE
jgi:hypothetical protein